MTPKLSLVRLNKRRRSAMKRHDEATRVRLSLERRLFRHVGPNVRVQVYRMTIGEAFNHARRDEVILVFRGCRPLLVPVVGLDSFLERRKSQLDAGAMYDALLPVSRKWAKQRKPVRRPEWQPRRGSR